MFELHTLRTLALENVSILLEIKDHTSILYQLLQQEGGDVTLQQLLAEEALFTKLLQNELFLTAILTILNNHASVLYLLSKTNVGHEILQQLMKAASFRANLLHHPAFTPSLLAIIENGDEKNASALYWLAYIENDCQILRHMLKDARFKTKLMQEAAFIPALLNVLENGDNKYTSALFWLLSTETGHQILWLLLTDEHFITSLLRTEDGCQLLQQLFADEYYTTRSLQHPIFMNDFLRILELKAVDNAPTLSWTTRWYNHLQTLQQMPADERVQARLFNHDLFIYGLLKTHVSMLLEIRDDTSKLHQLLQAEGGDTSLQQLLSNKVFFTLLLQSELFLRAFLDISIKRKSLLYLLSKTNIGHEILQKLMFNAPFRTHVLKHYALIPALSWTVQDEGDSKTPALYWLARTENGCQVLLVLLRDEPFREKLLDNYFSIRTFMTNIEIAPDTNTTLLYWLTRSDSGCQILRLLFSDVRIETKLMQEAAFIQALLNVLENRDNKYPSALFWLLSTENGHQILWLLLTDEHFVTSLLRTEDGCQLLQQLFADEYYTTRSLQHPIFMNDFLRILELKAVDNVPTLSWTTRWYNHLQTLQQMPADERVQARLFKHTLLIYGLLKTHVSMLLEIRDDTSKLHQLLQAEGGDTSLQQLLSNKVFFTLLLQHELFLPTFLHISIKSKSLLYLLSKTNIGHEILLKLMFNAPFRTHFLEHYSLITALLSPVVKEGEASTLFWLSRTENGCQVLLVLLRDEPFREQLLHDYFFIRTFMTNIEIAPDTNTTLLYWLARSDSGCQILRLLFADVRFITEFLDTADYGIEFLRQQLLSDAHFKAMLLQSTDFALAILKESDVNPPALWSLSFKEDGKKILQILIDDEPSKIKLLRDSRLIPALLKLKKSHSITISPAFYWLANFDDGHLILQQLLANEDFRTNLLREPTFLSVLLKSDSVTSKQGPFTLFSLSYSTVGIQILQQLLADELFKTSLLQESAFFDTLFLVDEDHSSMIRALADEEPGRQILRQLLADERSKTRLLQSENEILVVLEQLIKADIVSSESGRLIITQLISDERLLIKLWQTRHGRQILHSLLTDPQLSSSLMQNSTLLATVLTLNPPEGHQHNFYLFNLTTTIKGLLFLKALLKDLVFKETFCQKADVIKALFLQTTTGHSSFFNLLNTLDGCDIIQTLMQSPHFRTNFWQYFHIDETNEDLSWVFRSMLGSRLFKLLLQENQLDLLITPLQDLLAHPKTQLYVHLGALDPNLFLLISATEPGEVYFHYLQHPQCSPWAMTDNGCSLRDLINASSLCDTQKQARIEALMLRIRTHQEGTAIHQMATNPQALGSMIQSAVTAISPQLPLVTEDCFSIEGIDQSLIRSVQQQIDWICGQRPLAAYHALFRGLLGNTIIRNSHDFPIVAADLKTLCDWMNGYLLAGVDLPEPEPDWQFALAQLCAEAVQTAFKQLFATLSRQSDLARFLEHLRSAAAATYCRLLAIPINMEVHLPKAAIAAEMGFVSTLPTKDIYLGNLNQQQKRWIAQSAMDVLIHRKVLIDFLVDRLSFDAEEVTCDEAMRKYPYYRYSSLFDREMTIPQFMTQVTGLSEERLAERMLETIPIRPDLNALLLERASIYANHLPLYVDQREFQEKVEFLWEFLTTNSHQVGRRQRVLADAFLSQCEQATDGLALIKHCIESHRDNIDRVDFNAFFYQNSHGTSLFSLLIANPLFAEWLFDYRMVVTHNEADRPNIVFAAGGSFMSRFRIAFLCSEITANALASAIIQPGTLFFWLFYFQQDAQKMELFQSILSFIGSSPKELYTYDSLGAVLFDMLRSSSVTIEHKTWVQTFLQKEFNDQVQQHDARCWLTISLLPSPRETILATLRTNFWALRTLNNPEHMNTIRGLLREKEDVLFLQDPHAFLRREQEALRRNSLFNAALKDDEADASVVKRAKP